MREEQITLGTREQTRVRVLNRLLAGEWTQAEAALALGRSVRQVRRLLRDYRAQGVEALLHGNRGRAPAHAVPPAVREQVVALARDKYVGFNHQHLTEKLAEEEQLVLGRTTVRRILHAAGLASPRPRHAPKHRQRRERRAQVGMLVQADGSRHRWLGPSGPYLTLIGGIDDATGEVPWVLFREHEDGHGYMEWLQHVVHTHGIPVALYVDRHGIFQRSAREPWTREEELAGARLPTQFGRVLTELGIQPIYALSPQAKGRIERLWGTFQDRLCSELRLAGAGTLAEANAVLAAYLPRFNARFQVPAAQAGSAYRSLPPDFAAAQIFCFKYTRVVAADNTVQFGTARLQLLAGPDRLSYARAQVEVQEHLDGRLAVYYQGQCLATQPAPAEAPVLRARKNTGPPAPPRAPDEPPPPSAPAPAGRARRPARTHPWREPFPQKNEQTPSEEAVRPSFPAGPS
jgi:transposase